MSTILSIDLSTKCSGWALYEVETRNLISSGSVKSTTKGLLKYTYYESKLVRLERMARLVDEVVQKYHPTYIVIEEITLGKNRISQKTLTGQHWVLLQALRGYLANNLIFFYDVSGAYGWRTDLKLKMSIEDKLSNRKARVSNKKCHKSKKINMIGTKHLATRFVNEKFNLALDCDETITDGDEAEAVAMGYAFVRFRLMEGLRERGLIESK